MSAESGTITPVSGVYTLDWSAAASGTKTITFPTKDKFVDGDFEVNITIGEGTIASDSASVSATSNKIDLLGTSQSSAPSSGAYVKVSGSGTVSATVAGWIDANTSATATASDAYYPVTSGVKSISGGGLTAGLGNAALSSDGYYDGTDITQSDAVILSTTAAAGYYKLTATGSGLVNRAAITSQVTTAGYFDADGSPVQESAATSLSSNAAETEYYILKSTLSSDSITPGSSSQTVTISAGYYPSDRTVTISAEAGTIASSFVNSGFSTYFDAGTSSSYDMSVTPQYSVTSAGYVVATQSAVDGTTSYYSIKTTSITEGTTIVDGVSVIRGTASWNTGWITGSSISAATFANSGTSGTSYVDISNTSSAPVLVSGDYLYINKGYTDNLKISLAKLVPNGSDVKGHGEYILSGHSAYDDDGVLVAGTIQTYDGSYTIE